MIDAPEAKAGLGKLVEAFESGGLLFLRNGSDAYRFVATESASAVKDTFAVATLPGQTGPGMIERRSAREEIGRLCPIGRRSAVLVCGRERGVGRWC